MSIYKLAAAGSGGAESGLAQLDVQFDGIITAIHGSLRAALDADGEFCQMEASFLSILTLGTNDTRGSLFSMQVQMHLATSGANLTADNASVGGLAIQVNAGERLWLHMNTSASTGSAGEVYIYVEDGQAVPTAQRRR